MNLNVFISNNNNNNNNKELHNASNKILVKKH